MTYRYYEDPDYYEWVLITEGIKPTRVFFAEKEGLGKHIEHLGVKVERINPAPDSNPEWYISEKTKQWRREPPRGISLMREGIHAGFGLLMGVLGVIGLFHGWPLLVFALSVTFMVIILFLAYEITEGWRIKDWAYRDIGGFLMAYVPVTAIGAVIYALM